jgi:hypothetical protein
MVFNHTGNTTNGNAMNKVGATAGGGLLGRTTQLPILEVNYTTFRNNNISGPNLHTIVSAVLVNDDADLINGYRQPTDHDDRLGNLPLAPGAGVVYREYYLSGNLFTWPGFLRMVADLLNRRLYITPTHYDVWLQNPTTAGTANKANAIAANTASSRNPFFLLRGVNAPNNLFD